MNKTITAILLIGTSLTNFGITSLIIFNNPNTTKVSAQGTDNISSAVEMTQCGDYSFCKISDDGSTMTITGKGDVKNIRCECKNIKKLIVENGITSISAPVFSQYEKLEFISLPDSVNQICNGIFDNTVWYDNQPDGLVYVGKVAYKYKGKMEQDTALTFKEGTEGIAYEAFYECPEIKAVTFPDSITTIPYRSFSKCQNLSSVTIPDSVTEIGSYAFSECGRLEQIIIPDKVTHIGLSAFENCGMLQDISFPDSIVFMAENALDQTLWYNNQPDGIIYAGKTTYGYKGTMGKNTDLIIKEGTKAIANRAFQDCTNIQSVIIPDSVTNTGCDIFNGCTLLENIMLSESMRSIAPGTFYNCSGIKSVIIPENIKKIDESAFGQNTGLESVTFLSEELDIEYAAFDAVPNLRDVFYAGTEEDWNQKVNIDSGIDQLSSAKIHFNYSDFSDKTDPVLYGDINGDDQIDITDLLKLSLFLLKDTAFNETSLTAADVSGDGNVDIADLAVMKQYICKDNIKLGPKNEIKDRYCGSYSNDDIEVNIIINDNQTYSMKIGIMRLTTIDDAMATVKDTVLEFTGTDAAGNPISGFFADNGNDTFTLSITHSTWEYVNSGTVYTDLNKQ